MDMLSFFSSPPLTIPCLPANTGRSDPSNIELTGASLLFQDMQSCHSRITIRKAPSEGSGISSRSPLYFVPRLQESKLQSNQITIPTGGGPSSTRHQCRSATRFARGGWLHWQRWTLVDAGIGYLLPQTPNKSGSREGWLDGSSCRF